MYLSKLIVFNYRSCRNLDLDLYVDSPNIFIGLNDSGKSTLLQSINLLLGEKPNFNSLKEGNYKSDLSNTPESVVSLNRILQENNLPLFTEDKDDTYIIGKLKYEDDEAEKFANSNLSTPLEWSIESNEENVIWIAKKFNKANDTTYLLMNDSVNALELWSLPQAKINAQIKVDKITSEDIENQNGKGRFSNYEKIRAIYAKHKCSTKWVEYKLAKGDKDIFPTFKLFDWNTSLDEIVTTANAIMKDEIEVHLNPLKIKANELAKKAEASINAKFGEIGDVIKEVAKDVNGISSKVFFDVKEKISDVMVTKTFSDGPIHLENQGEGLKRQIWFSLIKAKADTTTDSVNKFIWAFDEPETHLYPQAQREFFDTLNKISMGNVQTLISTHSTIFIDKSNLNKINSVKQENDGYSTINSCKDIDAIYSSLNVKNSDFLFHDKFLIVEGDTEQHLIPKLYELYTRRTLMSDNIQLINIQGKDKWTQNKGILDKIMSGFKKTENQLVFLFDNDMSFEIGQSAIKPNMFFVGEQDIEDSIENEIWLDLLNFHYRDVFKFEIDEVEYWKSKVVRKVKCNSNQKFYSILKNGIKDKCIKEDVDFNSINKLPSKGIHSAEFLMKYIDIEEKIPQRIKDAFDLLNK
ncbi:hypothetical protein C7H62_1557 [Mesoflavibacter sp. HG96]|uniref:ATP-dependent nuclease n=1 Tax=unclassified Mesoflavibacter TaxID=2630131 RepID=UPI000D0F4CE9|nr:MULTISPECIES: AAA family ATPase [unclassified Mesoflavibacter]QIJ89366.1 hypothetical protein C7H62_1557 [Mesoflavibacter sp. HG96]QIJ92094.1 hypothetical protein C7H56_1557 [Mesoflavibacter sp. HG37]